MASTISDSIESSHTECQNNVYHHKSDGKSFYYYLPARILLVLLGFLAFVLIYGHNVVLSVAIVAMVGHKKNNNSIVFSECLVNNSNSDSGGSNRPGEFDWTPEQQSLLLGAYFYGYVITQIPAGFLAQKYGAKWIFGVSMLATAILSLLIPFASRIHWLLLFVDRLFQGKLIK